MKVGHSTSVRFLVYQWKGPNTDCLDGKFQLKYEDVYGLQLSLAFCISYDFYSYYSYFILIFASIALQNSIIFPSHE